MPANCVGERGCQFCHLAETPAAKSGSTEKCTAWVCSKYDVTGCLGVAKRSVKKHYDIGDCKNDVGNRNVGRHVFRDWDCANDEGVPSACQKPGETPCRLCLLKSAESKLEGWPYCPEAVCHFMNIDEEECPGIDYVPKISKKHHHHKKSEDEDEEEEPKSKKSKKVAADDDADAEEETSSKKHSKKHSTKSSDDEDDDTAELGKKTKHHHSHKHKKAEEVDDAEDEDDE